MKRVIAIIVGALCASTVHAETFVVEAKGVVRQVIGQSGGVLDGVQVGDAVTQTFVFDTARFPVIVGDGATSLTYSNAYQQADAVRSSSTVGAIRFDGGGYPFARESATAIDSFVAPTPVGVPPPPPQDRFAVSDMAASVPLDVPDARGLIRWAAAGASAPGASSMVRVPVTSLADVNLAEGTAFGGQLIEGGAWANPALPPGGLTLGPNFRVVFVTIESETLRRCAHRLRWFETGAPWPKHGVHCEASDDEDDDENDD